MAIDPIVDSAFPMDVYDLYNDRLANDQPWVDTLVASIKYQIYDTILNNLPSNFIYDASEWIGGMDIQTQARIMDQVFKYFRQRGIRAYMLNSYLFNNTVVYGTTQIDDSANFLIVTVEWFVRNQQEFMKAYLD